MMPMCKASHETKFRYCTTGQPLGTNKFFLIGPNNIFCTISPLYFQVQKESYLKKASKYNLVIMFR